MYTVSFQLKYPVSTNGVVNPNEHPRVSIIRREEPILADEDMNINTAHLIEKYFHPVSVKEGDTVIVTGIGYMGFHPNTRKLEMS